MAANTGAAWSQADVNAITVSSEQLVLSADEARTAGMALAETTSRLRVLANRDGEGSSVNAYQNAEKSIKTPYGVKRKISYSPGLQ
ncbi:hypothetical protein ANCDUO_17839 [Ancylostoma duodenale]|uniref:Uncharacterized protein n=1 Tax=Ancylostoma duodenale TaxID=51022 RepID=A0A0C2FTZ2_9BILA|nr:hypothetical protein ANCDUO_17839 [Ancylostoma duodenale]